MKSASQQFSWDGAKAQANERKHGIAFQILGYFHRRAIATGVPGDELINEVLRQHVAATGYIAPVLQKLR